MTLVIGGGCFNRAYLFEILSRMASLCVAVNLSQSFDSEQNGVPAQLAISPRFQLSEFHCSMGFVTLVRPSGIDSSCRLVFTELNLFKDELRNKYFIQ